jgi:hypothetical protein
LRHICVNIDRTVDEEGMGMHIGLCEASSLLGGLAEGTCFSGQPHAIDKPRSNNIQQLRGNVSASIGCVHPHLVDTHTGRSGGREVAREGGSGAFALENVGSLDGLCGDAAHDARRGDVEEETLAQIGGGREDTQLFVEEDFELREREESRCRKGWKTTHLHEFLDVCSRVIGSYFYDAVRAFGVCVYTSFLSKTWEGDYVDSLAEATMLLLVSLV